jgi:hypothetical protein
VLDNAAIAAKRHHYNINAFVDAYRDVTATREGYQQVHGDSAPWGFGANVIDRHSQLTGQRQPQGAQSASLGDRPGQRSATHPGLTHRNVEAESICDVQLSYPPWAAAASSNARTVV